MYEDCGHNAARTLPSAKAELKLRLPSYYCIHPTTAYILLLLPSYYCIHPTTAYILLLLPSYYCIHPTTAYILLLHTSYDCFRPSSKGIATTAYILLLLPSYYCFHPTTASILLLLPSYCFCPNRCASAHCFHLARTQKSHEDAAHGSDAALNAACVWMPSIACSLK